MWLESQLSLDSNHATLWLESQIVPDLNHTTLVSLYLVWFKSPLTQDSNHIISHIFLLATAHFDLNHSFYTTQIMIFHESNHSYNLTRITGKWVTSFMLILFHYTCSLDSNQKKKFLTWIKQPFSFIFVLNL